MTRAIERTDSAIHLFSHWAIVTRALERTDSEIHSLTDQYNVTKAKTLLAKMVYERPYSKNDIKDRPD